MALAILGGWGLLVGAFVYDQAPERHFRRGIASLRVRDWEGVNYAHLALKGVPLYETRDSLLNAALLVAEQKPAPALTELRFAARNEGTRAVAYELAAEALYAQKNFRGAEASFLHAVTLDPNLSAAHRRLAAIYYDIGLMSEALNHLQRLAELEPTEPQPHHMMGVIHMDFGNPSAAVDDFEESLRRGPELADRHEMLLDMAQCQRQLHRYEDARRTLAACGDSAETLALSADVWYHQGDSERAKQCASRALELAANQRLALLVLSRIAFDERRSEEAVELLARAAKAAPHDHDIRYSLATALRQCGRSDEAAAEMHAADELIEKGKLAQTLLQQATEEPYDADLRYRLGELAEQLGAPDIADTWYRAALLLAPAHPLARSKLKNDLQGVFGIAPQATVTRRTPAPTVLATP